MAVYRSRDLRKLDTSVHLGFGDLVVAGEYNCTGHLGTVWLQLPVDRWDKLGSDMYPMFDYVWNGKFSTGYAHGTLVWVFSEYCHLNSDSEHCQTVFVCLTKLL